MDVTAIAQIGLALVPSMDKKPLERRFRRPVMQRMRVTLFRLEDELGLLSLPQHGESAFGVPLRRLECRTILSTSEELAAAMAYRHAVSIHRLKRLKALRAPKIIIDNEVKLHAIVDRLRPLGPLNGQQLFVINNLCECWLLCVEKDYDCDVTDSKDTDVDSRTP